ncbi:MAG: sigma-70 family RNA polymerase sigma factor [Pseudomonadota bacterium]
MKPHAFPITKEFFDRNRPRLINLAHSIVGDASLAEDIVQEAFLHLSTKPETGSVNAPLSYLTAIVRNLSVDLVRSQVRERAVMTDAMAASDTVSPSDFSVNPETIALWRSEYRIFAKAAHALPEPTRSALHMYLFEEKSLRAIAKAKNLSLGKVHYLIRDGLAACANALDDRQAQSRSGPGKS